ncbi:AAA family ATPase [Spirochaeta lutea]|uniref:Rad50/SbcC-type AAA domain-containing protein n=1 Tax=Spirochaeta lutea TaxID=1480694 RepID=A0A098QV16_9SPIO|nr:SMC family ATPase [Spirochaeta lutea]KGE71391.1 hypothetical protein DC28_11350 [Spirochaeta lutea]
MIPQHLTIQGLYSYKQAQHIDFSTLTKSEVFGIFGPVGSGKSTILEAVLFALYGKTERLSGNEKIGPNMINLSSQKLWIDFRFKHGTQEYRFTVENRRRKSKPEETESMTRHAYRLVAGSPSRSAQTSRDPENSQNHPIEDPTPAQHSPNTPRADLSTDLSTEHSAGASPNPSDFWEPMDTGEKSAPEVAEEILGLSYDAFRRTVIIPQGKFQEFLQLGQSERSKMLLELFNLDRFNLNRRAQVLRQRLEAQTKTLEKQLEEVGPATPQELEAITRSLAEKTREVAALEEQLTNLQTELNKARRFQELHRELEEKRRIQRSLDNQAPEMQTMEQTIARAEVWITKIQPLWERRESLDAELQAQHDQIRSLHTTLETLTKDIQELEGQLSPLAELQGRGAEIRREQEHLLRALEALDLHQRSTELHSKIHTLQTEIAPRAESLSELNVKLADLGTKVDQNLPRPSLIQTIQTWHTRTAEATRALQDQRSRRDRLDQEESERHREDEILRSDFSARLTGIASQLDPSTSPQSPVHPPSWDTLLQGYRDLETALRTRIQEETETAIRNQELQRIKGSLKEGDPCPVCGVPYHRGGHADTPGPAGTPERDIPNLTSGSPGQAASPTPPSPQLQELKEILTTFGEDCFQAAQANKTREDHSRQQHRELDSAMTALEGHLEELLRTPPPELPELPPDWQGLADPTTFPESMARLAVLQDQQQEALGQRTALDREKQHLTAELHRMEITLEQHRSALNETGETCRRLISQLPPRITDQLPQDLITPPGPDASKTLTHSKTSDAALEELREHLRAEADKTAEQLHTLETRLPELSRNLQAKKQDRAVLSERQQHLQTHAGSLESESADLSYQISRLSQEHHLSGHTLDDLRENPPDTQTLKAALERYHQESRQTDHRIAELLATLKGLPGEPRPLEELEALAGTAAARRDELLSDLGSLETTRKLTEDRLSRRTELQSQLNHALSRRDAAKVLANLLKGDAFLDFVAQTYLQDLVSRANRRFMELTRQSLELELGPKNEFLIRDLLHGGRLRSVKTLSGGQTFQAAFSLAIALADYLDHQGGGFFFMDEGFGSLDRDSLDIVFQSLRHLRRENRLVGIISHVEDLKQEIQTYLSIENDPKEGSIVSPSWE